jgi:hypothetical protein
LAIAAVLGLLAFDVPEWAEWSWFSCPLLSSTVPSFFGEEQDITANAVARIDSCLRFIDFLIVILR